MSLLSKINFRRILAIFLVQVALFLGSALVTGNDAQTFATVLNREANDALSEKPLNDAEYEAAKARRRELQAQRSELASKNGNKKPENLQEKLNLNESVPSSTKKFFKQVEGKKSMSDKTEPANAQDYTTPRPKLNP